MAKLITSRAEDYSRWYTDLVLHGRLADHSPVVTFEKFMHEIHACGRGLANGFGAGADGPRHRSGRFVSGVAVARGHRLRIVTQQNDHRL